MSTADHSSSHVCVQWDVATITEWHTLEKHFSRRCRHQGRMPDKLLVMRGTDGQVVRSAIQYIDKGFYERWGIQNHPSSDIRETWSVILGWLRLLVGDRDIVEVYPRDLRIINTAPIRWFWVLPNDLPLAFDLSKTAGGS